MKTASWILGPILVSGLIYFAIAALLIVSDRQKKPAPEEPRLAFGELLADNKEPPQLETYKARNGTSLTYRFYPSRATRVVILVHGSGWHSRYLVNLAEFISSENLARVYTPDLRGHGRAPERRGDIDYIDQLEDDLSDFVAMARKDNPGCTLVVGGHSSGGGLAIRFAGSKYGRQADAYMLLSPWLKYNAPTIRPGGGRWARPYTRRIIGLSMLNNLGIHRFDGLTAIGFDMPKNVRNGTETLSYSHRLNTGYAPRDYRKDLRAIKQPLLVIAGTSDELFLADRFEPVISQFARANVKLLPGLTHMGVVVNPAVRPVIEEWLESLGEAGQKAPQ